MGIAAYNRGSEKLRRDIDARFDHDIEVINFLNSLPRGNVVPFGPTVIRLGQSGWWIMNREDEGWGSRGYRFGSLRELFAKYAVYITGFGQDEHSFFYRVSPLA